MNRTALFAGLLYSLVAIAVKLFIVVGGYSLTRFGYYYSQITLNLILIPVFIVVLMLHRRKTRQPLSGREAMRLCLTVVAIAAIILSAYNYMEYERSGKALAKAYYNGEEFLRYMQSRKDVKPEAYDHVISEQVAAAENAGFKATTGKLFSLLFVGISGAFIVSMFMKNKPASRASVS